VSASKRFTAVVMAGSRAAGDPLAVAGGVSDKAFVSVAGTPMLARVVATLRAADAVDRIVIVGLDPAQARAEPALAGFDWTQLELIRGGDSPAASATVAIESLGLAPPVLITTADHPLLTAATVDEFCRASHASGVDVTFGVAHAERVVALFPGIRRTVHRFRDENICGCNLFALLTVGGCQAPQLWRQVESYRKQPWRMVAMLGVPVLLRFLLGRLALDEVGRIIEARLGLRAAAIRLSDPAAGFDVDTVEQRAVAERYLQRA
jgi:GTP:adenosylcobinamide-phosphate guanylyltransferase